MPVLICRRICWGYTQNWAANINLASLPRKWSECVWGFYNIALETTYVYIILYQTSLSTCSTRWIILFIIRKSDWLYCQLSANIEDDALPLVHVLCRFFLHRTRMLFYMFCLENGINQSRLPCRPHRQSSTITSTNVCADRYSSNSYYRQINLLMTLCEAQRSYIYNNEAHERHFDECSTALLPPRCTS